MTANIVPFGKHKGRLVEELLLDDPNYLQWLASQDWFRAKYVTLYQIVINRGAEPEETPEHNALQVMFLDEAFCLAFVRCLWPDLDEQATAELKRRLEDVTQHPMRRVPQTTTTYLRRGGPHDTYDTHERRATHRP